jgi:hypothetical protein
VAMVRGLERVVDGSDEEDDVREERGDAKHNQLLG